MPKFTRYICTCALFWFLGHNVEEVILWYFYMTKWIIVILRQWSSILPEVTIHNWIFLEELSFEFFFCFSIFFVFFKDFIPQQDFVKNFCLICISTKCFARVLCFQLCVWELKPTKFAFENERSVRRKFFRRRNSKLRRQDSVSSEDVNVSFWISTNNKRNEWNKSY